MSDDSSAISVDSLYHSISAVLAEARSRTYRTINSVMVEAYWQIGYLIVEYEQEGKERAGYGKAILKELSKRLSSEFGKGFDITNLRKMRQFYILFSKRDAVSLKSDPTKRDAMRPEFRCIEKHHSLRGELCWTHYRHLLRVDDPKAREWYMNEAANCNWSTRALDRQINSLYYERLLASPDKNAVIREAEEKTAPLVVRPEHLIKDPYILEFLNLNPDLKYLEKDIEQGLIDKLQEFLLELGKGFSFVARQQRISTETSEFYIDLVFYNYILKCFVLIDLKTGKLTHQDIGQMDMYVRLYEDKMKLDEDNPTIGIILCTEKEETVARYSVLNENKHLFASKYKLYLPTEQELIDEIEREKEVIIRAKYEQKESG